MKKFKIHPLFIFYICLLLILGQFESIFVYFVVVCLHEIAHSYVAKKLGYKLDKMLLMPYGVCLNYKTNNFSPADEIMIAISGPLVNLFLAICCFAIWWVCPIMYYYTYLFCFSNCVMFAFNLLPCFPLDGGRVLAGLISKKNSRKIAIKITLIFNILISLMLIFVFIFGLFFNVVNFNLIIISIFLICSIFEPQKSTSYNYISYNFSLKSNKKGIKFILIYSNEQLYKIVAKTSKFKFNVFYIIYPNEKIKMMTEITLNKLILKYDSTQSLDEVDI